MSEYRSSSKSAGVNKLRALFENQNARQDSSPITSPELRGRSPAHSITSDSSSTLTTSKVRASWYPVQPPYTTMADHSSTNADLMRVQSHSSEDRSSTVSNRRGSFSMDTDSAALDEVRKSVSEEKQARRASVDIKETIPESALLPSAANTPFPEIKENEAMGSFINNEGNTLNDPKLAGTPGPKETSQEAVEKTISEAVSGLDKAAVSAPEKEMKDDARAASETLNRHSEHTAPRPKVNISLDEPEIIVPPPNNLPVAQSDKITSAAEDQDATMKPSDPKDEAAVSGGAGLDPPTERLEALSMKASPAAAETSSVAAEIAPEESQQKAQEKAAVPEPVPERKPSVANGNENAMPSALGSAPRARRGSVLLTGTSGAPKMNAVDEQPKISEVPKTTEAPKPSEAPKPAEVPRAAEVPKSEEAPKIAEAPKAKGAPMTEEAPITAEAPMTEETPITAEVPIAEAPKAAEVPKSPALLAKSPEITSPAKSATSKNSLNATEPNKEPTKKTSRTSMTSSSSATSKSKPFVAAGTKTSTSAPASKARPKSPTRPVPVSSRLTAPTAAFAAKLEPESSAKTGPAGPARSSSNASRDRTANVGRPVAKPAAAPARKPAPRPSLPAQPAAKKPEASRPSVAPRSEGFLERMMRPTAASASKAHEKTDVKSPPRAKPIAKPKQPAQPANGESLAAKSKRKVAEGVTKAKEAVGANGTSTKDATEEVPAESASAGAADPSAGASNEIKPQGTETPKHAEFSSQQSTETPKTSGVDAPEVTETPQVSQPADTLTQTPANFQGDTIR